MRNAKRRGKDGKSGAEEVLGRAEIETGSAKSRAAARMLAERARGGTERLPKRYDLAEAMSDPDQAWTLSLETIGGDEPVSRTVFAPAWMDVEDVRRFLYGDE